MKTVLSLSLICILTSIVSSCEDSGREIGTGPIPSGIYRYTSYDIAGRPIVKGWLALSFQDSASITGEWHLDRIGDPQGIGPQAPTMSGQVGSGRLIGGMNEGEVWVELNPQVRDDNLQLIGKIDNDIYRGQWLWISFSGISNHGTFEAVRN